MTVGRRCQRCAEKLDERRYIRGSRFCGPICLQQDRIERRAFQASRKCRLCGRPISRQGKHTTPVRSAHKASQQAN